MIERRRPSSEKLCAAIEAALAVAAEDGDTLVIALLEQAHDAARCRASALERMFRC